MKRAGLTPLEAGLLICGSGLGTGILAVPFLASQLGLLQIVLAISIALMVTVTLHLMVADLALASGKSVQLLSIFRRHLFTGPRGPAMAGAFFVLLGLVLVANLTLYATCAAEVMTDALGWPNALAKVGFFLVAAWVILPGLKVVGISEKYALFLIAAVLLILSGFALQGPGRWPELTRGAVFKLGALYSLCMFSFSALFAVPQIVAGLEDQRQVRNCIVAGTGANALITLGFTLLVIRSGADITTVATVGLSRAFGPVAVLVCAGFVVLAMLTSFWSIALAQLDIIGETFKLSRPACWLLATGPVLMLSLLLPFGYLTYIELIGGAVALIIALLVLPAYRRAIATISQPLLLGPFGHSKILIVLVFIFYLLMAVFSIA
jgi:amino acid permease